MRGALRPIFFEREDCFIGSASRPVFFDPLRPLKHSLVTGQSRFSPSLVRSVDQVLLSRIEPLLVEHRRPQQSGFTTGRSTADAILVQRLLLEVHREFNRPICVGYVDLNSAFDSVDRVALWKAVRGFGAPAVLLELVKDLYGHTQSQVRRCQRLSPSFQTKSGVREGCVLAPTYSAEQWIGF